MIKRGKTPQHQCSFCGRGEDDVMILVSGMEGQICEVCTEKAQEIIDQELRKAGVDPISGTKSNACFREKQSLQRPVEGIAAT